MDSYFIRLTAWVFNASHQLKLIKRNKIWICICNAHFISIIYLLSYLFWNSQIVTEYFGRENGSFIGRSGVLSTYTSATFVNRNTNLPHVCRCCFRITSSNWRDSHSNIITLQIWKYSIMLHSWVYSVHTNYFTNCVWYLLSFLYFLYSPCLISVNAHDQNAH